MRAREREGREREERITRKEEERGRDEGRKERLAGRIYLFL